MDGIPGCLLSSLVSGKSAAAARGRKGCRQIAPPLLTKGGLTKAGGFTGWPAGEWALGTRTGRGFCEKAEAVSRLGKVGQGTRAAAVMLLLLLLLLLFGSGGSG